MRLSSPAFGDGEPMPSRYTADGCNSSPPIRWHEVPDRAAELVLILEAADLPGDNASVTHWLVYKIPADSEGVPAGVPPHDQLTTPPGAFQGVNDFPDNGSIGYRGPALRHGPPRRYRLRLYALHEPLELPPAAGRDAVLHAMREYVIAEATLEVRAAPRAAA